MTRKIIRAIKSLPELYESDGTEFAEANGAVFAINPSFPPIRFEAGEWTELKPGDVPEQKDRVHVRHAIPFGVRHDSSPDCWCKPRLQSRHGMFGRHDVYIHASGPCNKPDPEHVGEE